MNRDDTSKAGVREPNPPVARDGQDEVADMDEVIRLLTGQSGPLFGLGYRPWSLGCPPDWDGL